MGEPEKKITGLGGQVTPEYAKETFFKSILAVERLHSKLHEILDHVLRETPYGDLSAVQALLIYNISDHKTTVGELKTRGFYLGTNVTYNLKKLVKAGYVNQVISKKDRRSMRVSLTAKGKAARAEINKFFNDEIAVILDICPLDFSDIENSLKVTTTWDQFWAMQLKKRKGENA